MPNIEMLQLLSQTFEVSINELISDEYVPDDAFRFNSCSGCCDPTCNYENVLSELGATHCID